MGDIMLNPYKVVEESDTSVTYQYRAFYSWVLLCLLVLLVVGMVMSHPGILMFSYGLIGLYFVVKLVSGKATRRQIRRALRKDSIEVSGNKYSFSNPLKITVPKNI